MTARAAEVLGTIIANIFNNLVSPKRSRLRKDYFHYEKDISVE